MSHLVCCYCCCCTTQVLVVTTTASSGYTACRKDESISPQCSTNLLTANMDCVRPAARRTLSTLVPVAGQTAPLTSYYSGTWFSSVSLAVLFRVLTRRVFTAEYVSPGRVHSLGPQIGINHYKHAYGYHQASRSSSSSALRACNWAAATGCSEKTDSSDLLLYRAEVYDTRSSVSLAVFCFVLCCPCSSIKMSIFRSLRRLRQLRMVGLCFFCAAC